MERCGRERNQTADQPPRDADAGVSAAAAMRTEFELLPFAPAEIDCLALPEIVAEKIRACYQRNKARDIYDLGIYATRPLDQPLVRRLVVLKLWQARDTFVPERLIRK